MTEIAPPMMDHHNDLMINKALPHAPSPHKISPDASQEESKPPVDQLLNHSHLKPGKDASLLSYAQTITMYKESAKKTNSPDMQYEFAMFMVEASKQEPEYLLQAEKSLRQLSIKGHATAQYELALLLSTGDSSKGKPELDKAFTLFVQASKHLHTEAAHRVGQCYEQGLGCRVNGPKAIQFYKKAASLSHPGSMYKLGLAYMNGDMGLQKSSKEALKWYNRSVEASYPEAIYEFANLHIQGVPNVIFIDLPYAVSLFGQAADMGHPPSAFQLGECYQYGKLQCQLNPALSIHYYTIAAEQGDGGSCFALTAWYLQGCPDILPQSNDQAYIWTKRAAETNFSKAEYALGYFLESGIGCEKDTVECMVWYQKAADQGDQRAIQRVKGNVGIASEKKKECCIM